jgi:hypothetical protein
MAIKARPGPLSGLVRVVIVESAQQATSIADGLYSTAGTVAFRNSILMPTSIPLLLTETFGRLFAPESGKGTCSPLPFLP